MTPAACRPPLPARLVETTIDYEAAERGAQAQQISYPNQVSQTIVCDIDLPTSSNEFQEVHRVLEVSVERRDGESMAVMQSRFRCSAYVSRHYQTALGGRRCDGRTRVEHLIRLRIYKPSWLGAIGGNRMGDAEPVFSDTVHMLSSDCAVIHFRAGRTQVHGVSLYNQYKSFFEADSQTGSIAGNAYMIKTSTSGIDSVEHGIGKASARCKLLQRCSLYTCRARPQTST